jgi:hypothetical protein
VKSCLPLTNHDGSGAERRLTLIPLLLRTQQRRQVAFGAKDAEKIEYHWC